MDNKLFESVSGYLFSFIAPAIPIIIEYINKKEKPNYKVIFYTFLFCLCTVFIYHINFRNSNESSETLTKTKNTVDTSLSILNNAKDTIKNIAIKLENVNKNVDSTLNGYGKMYFKFNKLLNDTKKYVKLSKEQNDIAKNTLNAKIIAEKPKLYLFFENEDVGDSTFLIRINYLNNGVRAALNFNGKVIVSCIDSLSNILDKELVVINNIDILPTNNNLNGWFRFYNFKKNNNLIINCLLIYNYEDEYLKPVTDTIYSICKPFVNNKFVIGYTNNSIFKKPLLNDYINRNNIKKIEVLNSK